MPERRKGWLGIAQKRATARICTRGRRDRQAVPPPPLLEKRQSFTGKGWGRLYLKLPRQEGIISDVSNVTLRKLRWIGVVAPAVFVGGLEFVRHEYFHSVNGSWFNVLSVGLVGGASYVFSVFIFRQVGILQRDSVRRSVELSALNNIVQAAGRSLDLSEVLKAITEKVQEVVPGTGGGIYLAQDRRLTLLYHKDLPSLCMAGTLDFEAAALKGCESSCVATAREGRANGGTCDAGGHCVFAPIEAKERVLGVFWLRRSGPLEGWEVDFLSLVSRQIGFAVEHARLHSQVEELVVLAERDRIAREIHDGLAQVLGYISLKTGAAQQMLAANRVAEARAELSDIGKVAEEAYTDAREAILGLRTSVTVAGGLQGALNEYISRAKRTGGLHIELEMEKGKQFRLLPAAEVQLIRIIQEALTNVRKHARATRAIVRLRLSDGVVLVSVEDDGHGFDVRAVNSEDGQHFGLDAMKERATMVGGAFRVESAPGSGTRVEVALPLRPEEEKVEVPQSVVS
ncbi:MAG: GAF domain-containing sensor histidine kinase [Chloroflexi bacterium]|nr:GAF domain-containing sensor histidine kinase [Chloroflexota bacterium]